MFFCCFFWRSGAYLITFSGSSRCFLKWKFENNMVSGFKLKSSKCAYKLVLPGSLLVFWCHSSESYIFSEMSHVLLSLGLLSYFITVCLNYITHVYINMQHILYCVIWLWTSHSLCFISAFLFTFHWDVSCQIQRFCSNKVDDRPLDRNKIECMCVSRQTGSYSSMTNCWLLAVCLSSIVFIEVRWLRYLLNFGNLPFWVTLLWIKSISRASKKRNNPLFLLDGV